MDRITAACIALSLVMLVSSGCRQTGNSFSSGTMANPAASPSAEQESSGPIVSHLKTRDKLITIRAGSEGPMYTVKSEDETVLAADLPAEELYAKFPELKGAVERGIANWAGLDPQYRSVDDSIESIEILHRCTAMKPRQ